MTRATIRLDDDSRRAVRAVADKLTVSASEAIRRAILRYRDELLGVPERTRKRRRATLERLFILFEGHDAEAEIQERKVEDRAW